MGVSIGIGSSPGGGGLTVVAETTLEADATDIEITGLDIDADGEYFYRFTTVNAGAGVISLLFNGDSAETGYYRITNNSTANANQAGNITQQNNLISGTFGWIGKMVDASGDTWIYSLTHLANSSRYADGIAKKFSGDVNLTQLNFLSTVANSLGVGTKLQIFKR